MALRAFAVLTSLSIIACSDAAGRPVRPDAPARDADLRVVSWNIKAARASSLDAVAERLMSFDADIIALQEVDQNVRRTGHVDQAASLAERLGYQSWFTPAIAYQDGLYGIAFLSRIPWQSAAKLELSNQGAAEARTAQDISLCFEAHCDRLVHHHADDVARAAEQSLAEILDATETDIGSGLVVLGDFNLTQTAAGTRALVSAGLVDLTAEFAAPQADRAPRIDYILSDARLAACAVRALVVAAPESDHDALLADFDFSLCAPSLEEE